MTHEEMMRDGARNILRDYDNPPEGGTLVPRAWVEEHLPELRAVAEAERLILGDLDNWKPAGFIQRAVCGRDIQYVTPAGAHGSVPCDLDPGHAGSCDSPQLLVRPAHAPLIWLG
jgi:hypothetical protein